MKNKRRVVSHDGGWCSKGRRYVGVSTDCPLAPKMSGDGSCIPTCKHWLIKVPRRKGK